MLQCQYFLSRVPLMADKAYLALGIEANQLPYTLTQLAPVFSLLWFCFSFFSFHVHSPTILSITAFHSSRSYAISVQSLSILHLFTSLVIRTVCPQQLLLRCTLVCLQPTYQQLPITMHPTFVLATSPSHPPLPYHCFSSLCVGSCLYATLLRLH